MKVEFVELVAALVGIPTVVFSLFSIIRTFVHLWREKQQPNCGLSYKKGEFIKWPTFR